MFSAALQPALQSGNRFTNEASGTTKYTAHAAGKTAAVKRGNTVKSARASKLVCEFGTMASVACLIGDDLGVLHRVEPDKDRAWQACKVHSRAGAMDKARAVQCMAVQQPLAGACLAAVGRPHGVVSLHSATDCQPVKQLACQADEASAVSSLQWLPRERGQQALLATHTAGQAFVHRGSEETDHQWSSDAAFSVAASLDCCAVNVDGTHVAWGGQGSEPCIHDLASGANPRFKFGLRCGHVGMHAGLACLRERCQSAVRCAAAVDRSILLLGMLLCRGSTLCGASCLVE